MVAGAIQTEQFVETVDEIQSIIDIWSSEAPMKIIGDFNTRLPRKHESNVHKWHNKKHFTIYSSILNDLILSNSLNVLDIMI